VLPVPLVSGLLRFDFLLRFEKNKIYEPLCFTRFEKEPCKTQPFEILDFFFRFEKNQIHEPLCFTRFEKEPCKTQRFKKIFFFVNKRMDTAQLMMERATSSHFETTEKQHECDWNNDHE
jgi:hypothetical protein